MIALSILSLTATATLSYGADPLQTVDVYQPSTKGPHPIAVFLHGGVWQHGERTDFVDVGRALADRGFVAFVASYRLAPASKWPAQAEDAASVVDMALKEAPKYAGDPARLVLVGHSAGAQMSSMLMYDDKLLARVHRSSKDVRALVLLSCVCDLKKPLDEAQQDGGFHAFIAPVFGVDDLVRASPIQVARALGIPIVVATGERDYKAMRAQTFAMNDKLRALQENVTLVDAPKVNHYTLPTAPEVLDAIEHLGKTLPSTPIALPTGPSPSP